MPPCSEHFLERVLQEEWVCAGGCTVDVVVKPTCQLGQAAVPRYSVKHYSTCFSEGILDETNIQISRL